MHSTERRVLVRGPVAATPTTPSLQSGALAHAAPSDLIMTAVENDASAAEASGSSNGSTKGAVTTEDHSGPAATDASGSGIARADPVQHVLLVHKALRLAAESLVSFARGLDLNAQEGDLMDLAERTRLLRQAVLAHCMAEEANIVPALLRRHQENMKTRHHGTLPPSKRRRTTLPPPRTVRSRCGGVVADGSPMPLSREPPPLPPSGLGGADAATRVPEGRLSTPACEGVDVAREKYGRDMSDSSSMAPDDARETISRQERPDWSTLPNLHEKQERQLLAVKVAAAATERFRQEDQMLRLACGTSDDHKKLRGALDALQRAAGAAVESGRRLRQSAGSSSSIPPPLSPVSPQLRDDFTGEASGSSARSAANSNSGAVAGEETCRDEAEGFRGDRNAVDVEELAEHVALVADTVARHLDDEERTLLPAFVHCLSAHEQGMLIVRVAIATFADFSAVRSEGYLAKSVSSASAPKPYKHIVGAPTAATLRSLATDDLVGILQPVDAYADVEEMRIVAWEIARALSPEQWKHVCAAVPRLQSLGVELPESKDLKHGMGVAKRHHVGRVAEPRKETTSVAKDLGKGQRTNEEMDSVRLNEVDGAALDKQTSTNNALIEITHLHNAIRKELADIVAYVADMDISDDLQLQSVSERLAFLKTLHSYHADGEDTVLVTELKSRMRLGPCHLGNVTADCGVPSKGTGTLGSTPPQEGHVASRFCLECSRLNCPPKSERASAIVLSRWEGVSLTCVSQEPMDELKLFDDVIGHISMLRKRCDGAENRNEQGGDCEVIKNETDYAVRPTSDIAKSTDGVGGLKHDLSVAVGRVASHLVKHMDKEEVLLLPLAQEYFNEADLGNVVRRVMAHIPEPFFSEVISWIVSILSVDDQESFLRNVHRTASADEFRRLVADPLANAVCHGLTDRTEWNELCRRIPELDTGNALGQSSLLPFGTDSAEEGPVSEVLRVHKAIRVELRALLRAAAALPDDDGLNPKSVAAIAERVSFLGRMVDEHSRAEDVVLLPCLEDRVPGVSSKYRGEHSDERALFVRLSSLLEQLQCATDENRCGRLVRKVRVVTRTLRDEMVKHLKKEEAHLWPMLTSHFSEEEQAEVVALIFGHMPSDRLQELLPWMIRVLSESEQQTMMTHILQVTKSTMFEKWLRSWFPNIPGSTGGDEPRSLITGSEGDPGSRHSMVPSGANVSPTPAKCSGGEVSAPAQSRDSRTAMSSCGPDGKGKASGVMGNNGNGGTPSGVADANVSAAAAHVLLKGRSNMVRAIKDIAKDTSLSMETRTRLMQRVMLAPWWQRAGQHEGEGPRGAFGRPASVHGNSLESSPREADGGQAAFPVLDKTKTYCDPERTILGCSHYVRSCKIFANCCGKLYTCRLCHDANETHVLSRSEITMMMCMYCDTLQDVAQKCRVESCGKILASYFCSICNLFDNDPTRSVYHCHSCNVCRAGKGLGKDFFHCMKCNQCMSMKYFKKHKCVERAMESDCPVCHQYLFMSTTPVKYLRCGHLMHAACKDLYVRNGHISCPICMKSLEDMAPVFEKLDEYLARDAMPSVYRTARCDIWCMDCLTASTVPYHFLYNKCPVCNSFNTRVDRVDANAAES